MIFCVSRPHSKSQHQSPNNSRKDKMSVKHPETNSKTILDLYVSNNLMRNLLSQPSIQIDNKISPSQDDQSFNSYRQQLQSNITERKTNKLLDDQLDDTTLSMTIKQKKTRNSQIKYVCDAFNQENPSSFTNLTEEDMEVHMPMRFKPFSFKD